MTGSARGGELQPQKTHAGRKNGRSEKVVRECVYVFHIFKWKDFRGRGVRAPRVGNDCELFSV